MSGLSLSAEEVLAWNDRTAKQWNDLVAGRPEMLELPCDIYGSATLGKLLRHIVAVELRYAQRLAGLPESPYDDVPYRSADEIHRVHDRAMAILRGLLEDSAYDWAGELEFTSITAGRLRAPRKTILFHALLHSIRHYAQAATLVRQHGYAAGFMMDYLAMGATRL